MLIAEIGMNHLGSKKRLLAMIESLVDSKIDALTIQIRENSFYTQKTSKLLLDEKTYKEAIKKVKDAGKKIGFAICDEQTLYLTESMGVDFYKIIRDGMNNHKLISKVLETNKTIIVSTGLSSIS
jgi:sialic acid synthase SpsE